MSIPEHISLGKKAFKPYLKFTIGDLVYAINDLKHKKLMVIENFIAYEKHLPTDYWSASISVQGKVRHTEFNEKELIKAEL
ncbi:MAG: hypothetical protein L3J54_02230 [Draconibacterium sp.]|nr:hypothetical protein [Draconibacterium sp.]